MVSEIVDDRRGLNRLCWLLVALAWPLIWVGGLVTTYDAGMSVPDWPGTYGYNLFAYPYKTWLFGPFDLFIEHGHRLLASVVGLVAIGVAVTAYRNESRVWVRRWCYALLAMVIAQGILGGFRVLLDARTLAMVHGVFGPTFFAAGAVAVAMTSKGWRERGSLGAGEFGSGEVGDLETAAFRWGGLFWVACGIAGLALFQLAYGARLRHASPTMSASGFGHVAAIHVTGAFTLWGLMIVAAVMGRRSGDRSIGGTTFGLVKLGLVQIALGVTTWVVKYGYPQVLDWMPGSDGYLLRSKGFWGSMAITGHVATGSLILALAAALAARVWHRRRVMRRVESDGAGRDVAGSQRADVWDNAGQHVSRDDLQPAVAH